MSITAIQNWDRLVNHTGTGPLAIASIQWSAQSDWRVFVCETGAGPTLDDEIANNAFTATPSSTLATGLYSGVSITLSTAVAGKDVYLVRDMAKTQAVAAASAAATVTDLVAQVDELVAMAQDLDAKVDRAFLAPPGVDGGWADLEDKAGYGVIVNGDEDGFTLGSAITAETTVSAAMVPFVTAATQQAALNLFAEETGVFDAVDIGAGNRQFEISASAHISGYPVALLKPTTADSRMVMDIVPNGTPSVSATERFVWFHWCSQDPNVAAGLRAAEISLRAGTGGSLTDDDGYIYIGGYTGGSPGDAWDVHLGYHNTSRIVLSANNTPGVAGTLAAVTVLSKPGTTQMSFGVMDSDGNMDFYVNAAGQLWAPTTYANAEAVLPNLAVKSNGEIVRASRFHSAIVTVEDDAVTTLTLDASASGHISVTTGNTAGRLLAYGETLSTDSMVSIAAGANTAVTTGALTGTTGSDGNLTVSLDSDILYVENRMGSSLAVTIVCIGL